MKITHRFPCSPVQELACGKSVTQFPNKLIRFPIKAIREGFGSVLTICLKTAWVKEWQDSADLLKGKSCVSKETAGQC